MATAVGLTAGLLAGPVVSIIGFVATALYMSTSILDRISSNTDLKKVFSDIGKSVSNKAEDMTKSFGRNIEDLFDSVFLDTSKKTNQKKEAVRKVEDLNTGLSRSITNALREAKFTMSL